MVNTFSFTPVSTEEVKRLIESIDSNKAAKRYSYQYFKRKLEFFAAHEQKDINAPISALKFLNDQKETDIIPVYKKKSKPSKKTTGQ